MEEKILWNTMTFFISPLETIRTGFEFLEGPVWHRDGYLLFSDIPANRIIRMDRDRQFSLFREPSGHSNGLTFDPTGCLIACEHGNRRVSRTRLASDMNSEEIVSLADEYQNRRLHSPNDCVSRSDGMIFFTDPPYGIREEERELPFQGIFRVDVQHPLTLLKEGLDRPNGLAFSPDETALYVAETAQERIWQIAITPLGEIRSERIFVHAGRPDGMKVDMLGNLYVASTEGLLVFDPNGNRVAQLDLPERPSNCAFGDSDLQTLFITARTSLYSIRVAYPGITPWNPLRSDID